MGPSKTAGDTRFVVHLDSGNEAKAWDSRSYLDLLLIGIAFGLAICQAAPHFIKDEEYLLLLTDVVGVGIIIAALLMSIPLLQGNSDQKSKTKPPPTLSAVVDVLPLGVQISTTTTKKKEEEKKGGRSVVVGTPRFLPMEDIYDVIVNEIVMGRSVESKVMFRVRLHNRPKAKDGDASGGDDEEPPSTTIFQLLREGSIELVDAFPPVKLSHLQCLELCEGISEAIDSYK